LTQWEKPLLSRIERHYMISDGSMSNVGDTK
jgi:hypothetical protein